jgi:hypothetical protein
VEEKFKVFKGLALPDKELPWRPFRYWTDGYLILTYPGLKIGSGVSIMGRRDSKTWIGHFLLSHGLSLGVLGSKTTFFRL